MVRCGACGQEGHIRTNRCCPNINIKPVNVRTIKSRVSGDIFEYAIVDYLEDKNINPVDNYTRTKGKKLYSKYDQLTVAQRVSYRNKINKAFNYILSSNENMNSYQLLTDNQGKLGESSDIFINTNKRQIKISCKNNNLSLKHQRPSSLPAQINMNYKDSLEFKKKFSRLNEHYYTLFKDVEYFNRLTKDDIYEMYSDINELISEYLQKYLIEANKNSFLEFLLSYSPNKFIFQWLEKSNSLNVIDLDSSYSTPIKISFNLNYIYIRLDNESLISMRLHTASSKITKSLSLKYDTKINDITDILTAIKF